MFIFLIIWFVEEKVTWLFFPRAHQGIYSLNVLPSWFMRAPSYWIFEKLSTSIEHVCAFWEILFAAGVSIQRFFFYAISQNIIVINHRWCYEYFCNSMSSKIKFLQHYVILDFIQLWGEFCLFVFFFNYAYYAQHRMSFNAQGKPEKMISYQCITTWRIWKTHRNRS